MPVIPAASGLVEVLVRSCRSRIASQQIRYESFLAVGVALTGVCALLLMGTRYVPLATLPLVATFGVWLAIGRWRSTMPDEYAVAQRIDQREGLRDEIATAYHFGSGGAAYSQEVADAQYERAARTAAAIRPETVFPQPAASTRRNAAILLFTAILLLGLRAGLQSTISFEPPLATLLLTSLFGYDSGSSDAERAAAAEINRPLQEEPSEGRERLADRPDGESEASDSALPEESYEPPDESDEMPEVEGLITLPLEEIAAETGSEDPSILDAQAEDGAASDEAADTPQDPGEDPWSDEAQSLLDKLKQAFENMLETLDMASVESADSEKGREQGSGEAEQSSAEGDPADSGEAAQAMSSELADASMEGGQPGEESGETASAGNTSGEDSSGQESSGENASAAGTSDGSKEFAEAEQVEDFLGSLEELYMERAENMKGEVTIETRLAEQSASVPYNERSTVHTDLGGAVSRDEIPVQYRTYIQNYFQALRRNAE